MNAIQMMMDGLSVQQQKERSATQLTLGEMIKFLDSMPQTSKIEGLGELNSYRGYYNDLAFEPQEGEREVRDILAECRGAMGKVFIGYKGGEFVMGEKTPLWLACYGSCGEKIMGISAEGIIETAADDD